ncbi:MAG: epoxyqueuosine reductase [bacterium]|nr:epoxyqueuosine reductase [bacterium]
MENLSSIVKEMALNAGACAVGIATTETLEGGPPSADLSYVLPNAKSAVCFALPLNQEFIESYLGKKDHASHNLDNIQTNIMASGMALEMANFLTMKGFPSAAQASNLVYRHDTKGGALDEKPPIAHRYLAVRSGAAYFGLSGNVITNNEGAGIILASVVTEAELEPTEPLREEENYCDGCRLCMASCASGYMSDQEKSHITLGDAEFSYSKRRHHSRCDYVCGAYSGLHGSGKWSTWSPARFPIPHTDEEFMPALIKAINPYVKRPRPGPGFYHFLMPGNKVKFTCGNCQLLCHPDREVRKKRYKMLSEAGVVVQNPDGSCEAVSPEEAKKRLAAMSPETRALYEEC